MQQRGQAAQGSSARAPTALKARAKGALEHGRAREALAAAKKALAIDPHDAESWLVLGAAHQELGAQDAARAAFASCTSKATHGPKGECAALLR